MYAAVKADVESRPRALLSSLVADTDSGTFSLAPVWKWAVEDNSRYQYLRRATARQWAASRQTLWAANAVDIAGGTDVHVEVNNLPPGMAEHNENVKEAQKNHRAAGRRTPQRIDRKRERGY